MIRALVGFLVAWAYRLWCRHRAFIARCWADYEAAMAMV